MSFARAVQLLALAVTCCLVGCEPTVVIGQVSAQLSCADAGTLSSGDPVVLPWSTGFENETCDYYQAAGFCYARGTASYQTETAHVHSGNFAELFSAAGNDKVDPAQVRCVRQGVLPPAAYYGAWYYIPATATNSGLWNLFHFMGATTPAAITHGLWDVSLVNGPNGKLTARVLDFLYTVPPGSPGGNAAIATLAVPIASWFHLEFFFKRAKDDTGEAALYQDGVRVVHYANLITDDTNWGQWYVGNYEDALQPAHSDVYVDDVTIATTLGWTPP